MRRLAASGLPLRPPIVLNSTPKPCLHHATGCYAWVLSFGVFEIALWCKDIEGAGYATDVSLDVYASWEHPG